LAASPALVVVDTDAGLRAMVAGIEEDLAAEGEAKCLAVDLEHHSVRSFQGLTCLMQLSTRRRDWVVDTLALRRQVGPALAALFADETVVKVMYGLLAVCGYIDVWRGWWLPMARTRTRRTTDPQPPPSHHQHPPTQVFHGAESDVKWLQRDFSLYVVNLFDTFLAAKQLRPPPAAFSLAHLLQVHDVCCWSLRSRQEKDLRCGRHGAISQPTY
jgi:exosome complex exonuclease RRP6